MRLNLVTIFACLWLILLGPASYGQSPDPINARDWNAVATETNTALATALNDQARGRPAASRLRSAITGYNRLLDEAPLSTADRARVHFNLGLASLELGDLGAAVLNLRRAELLSPGRASIQRELETARARVATPKTSLPAAAPPPVSGVPAQRPASAADIGLAMWHVVRRIDPSWRWTASHAMLVAGFILLTARAFKANRLLTTGAIAALAVSAAAAASVAVEFYQAEQNRDVVIMTNNAQSRAGPDALTYPPARLNGRESLPAGLELTVFEARDLPEAPGQPAWLRVRERGASSSASVWLAASDVQWVHSSAR